MSAAFAPALGVPAERRGRFASAVDVIASAWRGLSSRQWLIAIALGFVYGVAHVAATISYDATARDLFVVLYAIRAARWTALMTLVACFLTFSGAVLREIGKRSMLRPWHAILLVCTVTVLAAGVADPIALALAKAAHKGLGSITVPFWAGVDWLTALSRLWSLSMPTVLIIVSMTTLVMLYIDKTTRAAQALAALQLRLADTQRRALAEQLQTAQAMVDPAFMFGTLALIEQRFEPEPALAQRLLDALIRYLRAAIPGPSEVVGTLGQQAELVRAYLDIECVRSTGRLQARVEVPASLEQRAFAPSLVLPLVAHAIAIGDDDRPSHIGWVEVSAWLDGGHLIVQVDDDRSGEGSRRETAALTDLRRRLAALYGNGASLTLDDRQPRGTRARIVIDDPGETT